MNLQVLDINNNLYRFTKHYKTPYQHITHIQIESILILIKKLILTQVKLQGLFLHQPHIAAGDLHLSFVFLCCWQY